MFLYKNIGGPNSIIATCVSAIYSICLINIQQQTNYLEHILLRRTNYELSVELLFAIIDTGLKIIASHKYLETTDEQTPESTATNISHLSAANKRSKILKEIDYSSIKSNSLIRYACLKSNGESYLHCY